MSHKALSHKLALFKAVLMLIRCLVIACHAEGREKQVTTWNPECKREQGPAPRAALDLWTVGKGFTWGNQLTWATWMWRHHPGWPFHLFSWGHLPAGRQKRHHKEKQRARTTQLEIEPLTTTWTSTQHHKSRQLYCFTELVVLLFHIYSSALFCWTHEVKSSVSHLLSLAAFWRLRLIRQMSTRQLHCCCTATLSPKLQGRGTEKVAGTSQATTQNTFYLSTDQNLLSYGRAEDAQK